jgi:glycosyltransferase involved in cell wall biosynthesis
MNLCHTLGIAQRVHFTNLISDHQYLSEIYRMASMFITASEIETQGIVLLEAAASGLPIVAVDATCISEIVHDQVSGFLTTPGNIPDLSNRIITLLNNPERARMMGINGRTLVEAHDIHRTWSLHEKLYQETAKKAHTRQVFKQRQRLGKWELVKARIGFK